MSETEKAVAGVLDNALEPARNFFGIDFAGVNLWNFLAISVFVWLILILIKPIRGYVRKQLRRKFKWLRDNPRLLFLSGYWSWVACAGIVFLTYGISLYAGSIMSVIEVASYMLIIVLAARYVNKLIDLYFEPLAKEIFAK